jgi:hypothetical protein
MIRRSFLGGILAAAAAPAIVRSGMLMRVAPVAAGFWLGPEGILLGRPISSSGTSRIFQFDYFKGDSGAIYAQVPLGFVGHQDGRLESLSDYFARGMDDSNRLVTG